MSERSPLRRYCAFAFLAGIAFVVYGSLVPFDFTGRPHWDPIVKRLWQSLADAPISKTDVIANILLYLPVGFFGGGMLLGHRSGWFRWCLLAVGLLSVTLCVSLFVEGLQALLPIRTPSLFDAAAGLVGTIVGLAVWWLVCEDMHRWAARWSVGARGDVARSWLLIYVIFRIAIIWWPMDITLDLGALGHKLRHDLVLNPFVSPIWHDGLLSTSLLVILLAAPFGMWTSVAGLARGHRRSIAFSAMLVVTLAAFIEAVQVLIVSSRVDSAEFLLNAAGGVVGVCLLPALVKWPVAPGNRGLARFLPVAGVLAAMAFYAIYNLSPFDFHLSSEFVRGRIGRLWALPFYSYYSNPQFKSLDEAFVKISLGLPLGAFLGLLLAVLNYRRVAVVGGLLVSAIFLVVVEAGQVLVPSRYPDDTDVLLAFTGVLIGCYVARGIALRRRQANRSISSTAPVSERMQSYRSAMTSSIDSRRHS